MRLIVEIPDEPQGVTFWALTRAILEAIEDGASSHCLEHLDDGWRHCRLGVSITRDEVYASVNNADANPDLGSGERRLA